MNNLQYSLFNAADDWIAPYIDDVTFEESLLLNILFQDRILMHEAHLFNSKLLAYHMQRARGKSSLIEYGARRGEVTSIGV